jgi:hypothetical protein
MATRYTDQHPQFTVFVNGVFSPAADGEVEFFTVGNTGAGNRKDTFSDPDLTVVNPNPMPLDSFGRSINPIFLEGTYNTIIRGRIDNILVQQDEVDNVSGSSEGAGLQTLTVQFATDLRDVETAEFKEAYVIGTSVLGDGGQGHFYFNSTSSEADNGVDVIEPTVGGGRWLLQNNAHNSFIYSQAAGTVDAITFNPTPVITALDKTRFFVIQSLGPNTVTGVTVTAGTSSTLPMKRDNSTDLVVGDTGSAGYQMLIKTNEAETEYILVNPYKNIDANFNVNTINANKLVNDSITTTQMGNNSVDNGALIDNSVSNTKLTDMGQSLIKGRAFGAGTGDPQDLNSAQVSAVIGLGSLAFLSSVGQAEIDAGAIHQGEIDTSTSTNGLFVVGAAGGVGTEDSVTIPGGSYSFSPQYQVLNDTGVDERLFFGAGYEENGTQPLLTQASVKSFATGTIVGGVNINAVNRFVNASAPWNIGDGGDIALFVYLRKDKDGVINGHSISPAPPWGYNGKTIVTPDFVDKRGKFKRVKKGFVAHPTQGGDLDEYLEWIGKNEFDDFEFKKIDQEMKNRDMPDIPQPFSRLRDGETVVMIEPCCDVVDKLALMHEQGDSVIDMFKDGFIELKEEVECEKPPGVRVIRPQWKKTRG